MAEARERRVTTTTYSEDKQALAAAMPRPSPKLPSRPRNHLLAAMLAMIAVFVFLGVVALVVVFHETHPVTAAYAP